MGWKQQNIIQYNEIQLSDMMQFLLLRLRYVDRRCVCYSRPSPSLFPCFDCPRHTSMHFSVGDAVPVDVYVGPYELPEGLGLGVKVRGIAVMTV